MDFFKRHLNLTLGTSWAVCGLLLWLSNVFAAMNLSYVIYYSFGFLLLVMTTWYLRRKSRSEWWILAWFPWFVTALLALKGMTPPMWAGLLQIVPLFLIGLRDRTWRPVAA